MEEYYHSPTKAAVQLRDQLSSEKRKLGFFFGAGTSMAVGVPGVFALTTKIASKLEDSFKASFEELRKKCQSDNIEHILNMLRTIRELIGDKEDEEFYKVRGKDAGQKLDIEICKAISEIVSTTDKKDNNPHLTFCNWLFQNQATRYSPVEIFTSNYDLLIERALEQKQLPYFDGFVGTIDSFLIPECIEAENNKINEGLYVPYSWTRLWKIHGSINWFLAADGDKKTRIIRSSNRGLMAGDELMIYPSKQKYDESRRLPFIVFQDRLRKFLSSGEVLFVVNGYSFSDDHINEIIFESLRANNRLAITALMFGDLTAGQTNRKTSERVLRYGVDHPNFSIFGPDKACIGGVISSWDPKEIKEKEELYLDKANGNFNLGDFAVFTEYLKMNFGVLAKVQSLNINEVKREN